MCHIDGDLYVTHQPIASDYCFGHGVGRVMFGPKKEYRLNKEE
jgi:hypothetical protein